MKCVESYFQTIDDTKNFAVLQAIPLIIQALGRDYTDDSKSVWIATAIFFKIIFELAEPENRHFVADEIIKNVATEFLIRCFEYCKNGIADGAFSSLFSESDEALKYINFLLRIQAEPSERIEILALYLATLHLNTNLIFSFYDVFDASKLDSRLIFYYSAPLMAQNLLDFKGDSDGRRKALSSVATFYAFSCKNRIISKTEKLIMDAVFAKTTRN